MKQLKKGLVNGKIAQRKRNIRIHTHQKRYKRVPDQAVAHQIEH